MADATVVESYYDLPFHNIEVAELTVSDGETYQCRKFNKAIAAFACGGSDVDAHINCVISGGEITINYAGASDKKVYLLVIGV